MKQHALDVLRSPITIFVLIVVMGVTFTLTVLTSTQTATRDRQRATETKAQVAKNTHALCSFIEPAILTFSGPGSRTDTEANANLLKGLLESHTTIGCTADLTDGN